MNTEVGNRLRIKWYFAHTSKWSVCCYITFSYDVTARRDTWPLHRLSSLEGITRLGLSPIKIRTTPWLIDRALWMHVTGLGSSPRGHWSGGDTRIACCMTNARQAVLVGFVRLKVKKSARSMAATVADVTILLLQTCRICCLLWEWIMPPAQHMASGKFPIHLSASGEIWIEAENEVKYSPT